MENSARGPGLFGVIVSTPGVTRLAVAAYLAGFSGRSRMHTESDLPNYVTWCQAQGLEPLAATRPHIDL